MIYYAFFYGLMTLVGGVMDYVKAKSWISLVTGLISGGIIVLSAVIFSKGQMAGYYALMAVSLALTVFFGMKFAKSRAFMPAGLMLALSTLMLILAGFTHGK